MVAVSFVCVCARGKYMCACVYMCVVTCRIAKASRAFGSLCENYFCESNLLVYVTGFMETVPNRTLEVTR